MEILCFTWPQIDQGQIEPFVQKKSREDVQRLLVDEPTKKDANKVYLNSWDNWDIKKLPAKRAFFSLEKRKLSQARGEKDTHGAQGKGN